jgi:hypothetical protein
MNAAQLLALLKEETDSTTTDDSSPDSETKSPITYASEVAMKLFEAQGNKQRGNALILKDLPQNPALILQYVIHPSNTQAGKNRFASGHMAVVLRKTFFDQIKPLTKNQLPANVQIYSIFDALYEFIANAVRRKQLGKTPKALADYLLFLLEATTQFAEYSQLLANFPKLEKDATFTKRLVPDFSAVVAKEIEALRPSLANITNIDDLEGISEEFINGGLKSFLSGLFPPATNGNSAAAPKP